MEIKTILTVICVLTAAVPAVAETVTFAFEAEVVQVNRDPTPLDLPFDVEAGDTVRGTFTFEPLDVDSSVQTTEVNQPFEVTFDINSFSFSTTDYVAQSFDDALSDDDDGGDLAPPGPEDVIRLTRTLGADLGDPLMLQWGFAFAFFGDENVLDGADLPGDIGPWQSFSEGSLIISFKDDATGNVDNLLSTVRVTGVVPEPASVALLFVGILAIPLLRLVRPIEFS